LRPAHPRKRGCCGFHAPTPLNFLLNSRVREPKQKIVTHIIHEPPCIHNKQYCTRNSRTIQV